MAARAILLRQEARAKLLRGVNAMSRAVRVTLGPRGRYVLIDKAGSAPTIAKDGATVAKELEFADRFENMGAQMLKEVAMRTSDVVGDARQLQPFSREPSSRRAATGTRPSL